MEIFSFFNKSSTETKAVPKGIALTDFQNRGAIDKLYLPLFLYKPPFGWPRNTNIPAIRRLAQTPQAAMGVKAVLDVIDIVPWDIVPKEGFEEDNSTTKAHMEEVKAFFENPNDTKETFSYFQRRILRDMIEVNSGIIQKEFNIMEEMVGIRAADGATFLMNPNRFGKFTEREELILEKNMPLVEREDSIEIDGNKLAGINFVPETDIGPQQQTIFEQQRKAAYFQFPWTGGAGGKPVPFGIREIVWLQDNPTTSSIYGISIFENLLAVLQTLVYLIEFYQDYFEDNNIPKGVINLEGADDDAIDDFADRWNDSQLTVNRTGQIKKAIHRVPIANFDSVKFERIQFTAEEIDFIAATAMFSQLVWGMLGLNPGEMGFTAQSNRAVELSQDKKFMRKAILPRLRNLQEKYNREIISEFEFNDVEFKYIVQNLDDDTTKAKLWKIQLDAGWRTINEIRKEEGLPPMEGGDELNSLRKERIESERFEAENTLKGEQTNADQEQAMQDDRQKLIDGKASLTGERADVLREFEIFGSFRKILNDAKKKLIDLTRKNVDKKRTHLIDEKSLDKVIAIIGTLFSAHGIKSAVDQITKEFYRKGNDKAEKQLDMNLQENPAQIKTLADMTFDNIKGVTEDLKNNLRGILQRALISGKGIGTIADEIESAFNISKNRAETIARTETARSIELGQLNAMKSSGIELRKFVLVVLDDRTSQVCKAMHSKYGEESKSIPLSGLFKVHIAGKTIESQTSPFVPNCRTDILYITQDEFEKKDL